MRIFGPTDNGCDAAKLRLRRKGRIGARRDRRQTARPEANQACEKGAAGVTMSQGKWGWLCTFGPHRPGRGPPSSGGPTWLSSIASGTTNFRPRLTARRDLLFMDGWLQESTPSHARFTSPSWILQCLRPGTVCAGHFPVASDSTTARQSLCISDTEIPRISISLRHLVSLTKDSPHRCHG